MPCSDIGPEATYATAIDVTPPFGREWPGSGFDCALLRQVVGLFDWRSGFAKGLWANRMRCAKAKELGKMPQAKRFRLGGLSVRGLEGLTMRKSLLLSLAVVLGAACASASALGELQFRADQGLVDAAGFTQMAAEEIAPLMKETATNPTRADEMSLRASEVEKRYLAPLMQRAEADAAYGLGVQEALYLATCAALSPAKRAAFDEAFRRANANILSVTAPTIIAG